MGFLGSIIKQSNEIGFSNDFLRIPWYCNGIQEDFPGSVLMPEQIPGNPNGFQERFPKDPRAFKWISKELPRDPYRHSDGSQRDFTDNPIGIPMALKGVY